MPRPTGCRHKMTARVWTSGEVRLGGHEHRAHAAQGSAPHRPCRVPAPTPAHGGDETRGAAPNGQFPADRGRSFRRGRHLAATKVEAR